MSATPISPPQLRILTTGANRGIGFSIIQALGTHLPDALFLLGSRSQEAGEEAVKGLRKRWSDAGIDGEVRKVEVLVLDVSDDRAIERARSEVERRWGGVDVLINNAGIAIPYGTGKGDLSELRSSFNTTMNTNVTSIAAVTEAFLPLLHASSIDLPKIINISSGRASLARSSSGTMAPTMVVSYSISKAAVNALTIEMQKSERGTVDVYCVNPGFCSTAFNGFKGTKDPLLGAEVVVRLVLAERGKYRPGAFWEFEDGEMREVPW
ncbi:hypothetical protein BP6252_08465 [Coleophoma cylindrospora]|uniref:NAD(P)-binding protein n=1 Tax=Coleophoma cylindrospora TaxID=1849047 RepID=A0A3D8R5X2_9HELO|nr:hypothetical protein BP6252_08465 [Coleophoma cylindrospora]